MMTPDREYCREVMSRQQSLDNLLGVWIHDEPMGLLGCVHGICAIRISTSMHPMVGLRASGVLLSEDSNPRI